MGADSLRCFNKQKQLFRSRFSQERIYIMSNNRSIKASASGAAAALAAAAASASSGKSVDTLIGKIKDSSAEVRTQAWQGAGEFGAAAVGPLAKVMTVDDMEVARAAKRALWQIVRYAGRPGADEEKEGVAEELAALLGGKTPIAVRREVLWMLSEIGERQAIEPIAELLGHRELREDARMVLERIPVKASLAALRGGFKASPEDFKGNIAQSLRKRGKKVRGYECVKLVPTKETSVKALPK